MEQFHELEKQQMTQKIIGEKQTTLIKNTFENIENYLNSHVTQIESMNKEVNELKKIIVSINTFFTRSIEEQQKLLSMNNKLHSIMDLFILIMMQFERKQAMFLESIAAGQRSPNSPVLIPPEVLRKELNDISTIIAPLHLKLPLDVSPENLAIYYQISAPEARIVNDNLLVSFLIPLVNSKQFKLYKATSLPYHLEKGIFAFIVPKHEYFALDSDRYDFIDITAAELNNCYKIHTSSSICKQEFPIFSTFHSKACEINILIGRNLTEQCDTRVANMTNELWIKIQKYNAYIYTLPVTQYIHITCSNVSEPLYLHGTGIITISPGCKLKSNSMEIIGFQTFESNIFRSFTPSIPLHINISEQIDILVKLPGFEIPPIEKSELIGSGENSRLADISIGLHELSEMEENLSKKMSPHALQKNISMIKYILAILAIVTLIIILKFAYKKWNTFNSPNRAIQERNAAGEEIYMTVK